LIAAEIEVGYCWETESATREIGTRARNTSPALISGVGVLPEHSTAALRLSSQSDWRLQASDPILHRHARPTPPVRNEQQIKRPSIYSPNTGTSDRCVPEVRNGASFHTYSMKQDWPGPGLCQRNDAAETYYHCSTSRRKHRFWVKTSYPLPSRDRVVHPSHITSRAISRDNAPVRPRSHRESQHETNPARRLLAQHSTREQTELFPTPLSSTIPSPV